jgi:RNA polymerase sigma-70 factor (ECF subfamily)
MVFTNLWEKRNDLHLNTSIRSYLFTSVHNRCLNYIRDHKKFVSKDLPQSEEVFASQIENRDFLETEELEKKIITSLQELPESCRKIFILSRFDNKKYREIADEMDISIKTVETQMSKALKILREKLSAYIGVLSILGTLIIKWLLK